MDIALLGGDARQARLAELFAEDGYGVRVFGMEKIHINNVCTSSSAGSALGGADAVVLPLPVLQDGKTLNAPYAAREITLEETLAAVPKGKPVFAGRVGADVRAAAAEKGLQIVDYLAREECAVLNANATAEGAIQIIMNTLTITMLGAKILVAGFGRIGKLLAMKLRALGSDVTVSARRHADFAWIKAFGLKAADTRRLGGTLAGFNAIVNTVPDMIFGEKLFSEINKKCFCLDLASKPGGMDLEAAARVGVKAVQVLSIPGKALPESAAAIIRDTIYNILEELECTH